MTRSRSRTKSLPIMVSETDLAKRDELVARERQLLELQQETTNELLRLQGRWQAFREDIEARYSMVREDTIDAKGTIERVSVPEASNGVVREG